MTEMPKLANEWAVVDAHGARVAYASRFEAVQAVIAWDKRCPNDAPHRAVRLANIDKGEG